MSENYREGIIYDLIDILRLLVILLVRKINHQHILCFTAFLTFGVGDGITGALMMNARGAGIEANPIMRYLFISQGFEGIVTGKVWFTLILLFAVYITQLRSSTSIYWTVNGFLIALTAGGLMAMYANLAAMAGEVPASLEIIIIIYLFLTFVFVEIGSFVDRRNTTVIIE